MIGREWVPVNPTRVSSHDLAEAYTQLKRLRRLVDQAERIAANEELFRKRTNQDDQSKQCAGNKRIARANSQQPVRAT